MKIINLSENNSVLNHYLKEIRSVEIQNDSMRFRRNMERIGEIMAYEISKSMHYTPEDVKTPLGIAPTNDWRENCYFHSFYVPDYLSTLVFWAISIKPKTLCVSLS